jgi:protein-tyrosine phosphatase
LSLFPLIERPDEGCRSRYRSLNSIYRIYQAEIEMANKEPVTFRMGTRVLFVCMGNICQSPLAEGVFRQMVRQAGLDDIVTVASTGTHGYHLGEAPDRRAQTAATKRGLDIGDLRATRIADHDLDQFDLILAMDWDNLSQLQQTLAKRHHHKIQLLMRFATEYDSATIPDPYYGSQAGFDQVLDYIEDACGGLLELAKRRATQVAAA